jgi:hypothetical protein
MKRSTDSNDKRKLGSEQLKEGGWIDIRISRSASFLIYGMVLLPCFLALGFFLGRSNKLGGWKASPPTASVNDAPDKSSAVKPGPWGNLEYIPFFIECPEEFLDVRAYEASDRRWFFKDYSREQLTDFLGKLDLTADQRKLLVNSAKWEPVTNGLFLTPPAEVVLSLTQGARKQIYTVLAKSRENSNQQEAIAIPAATIDNYFEKSGLSEKTISLVKKLCYPHSKLLLFADMSAVLDTLPNYEEKRRLAKALSRRSTLLVKVHVKPDSDVNALLSYWAKAGQAKDLRPLLESLSKVPGGARVNLSFLLPPWPTARLYTYPFPSYAQPENCHWTSFNFFRDPPDAQYTDVKVIRQKLDADYYPVFSDPRYGDLVFLTKPSGEIIHSAVFLADNIVYTKNGGHFSAPWMLTTLPELVETYSAFAAEDELLKVLYYRNKYY